MSILLGVGSQEARPARAYASLLSALLIAVSSKGLDRDLVRRLFSLLSQLPLVEEIGQDWNDS